LNAVDLHRTASPESPHFFLISIHWHFTEAYFYYGICCHISFSTYGIFGKAFIFVKMFYSSSYLQIEKLNSTFSQVTSVFMTGIDGMYLFYLVTYFDVPRNTRQGRQHSLK
jgi:hypothetical protein